MSSGYRIKAKALIEANCTNNIHTGENIFLQRLYLKVCESFLFRETKKICGILRSA